jgi:putative transposase
VTQRGNNRQDVFFVDDDRRFYLWLLREQATRHGLAVDAYCLMPNHVHLVATPAQHVSLAEAFRRVNLVYAQYVNRLHGRSGHLWQNRFFSCVLDEEHYWAAMLYVERNPVRAGLAPAAWQWGWSSAAAHCGGADPSGLLPLDEWRARMDGPSWKGRLARSEDELTLKRLRLCTSRGRPLGSDGFVSKLEVLLGRRLRPRPHGRPRNRREQGRERKRDAPQDEK